MYIINISCTVVGYIEDVEWFSATEQSHDHKAHSHNINHHQSKEKSNNDDNCCDDEASIYFITAQVIPVISDDYTFTPNQFKISYAIIKEFKKEWTSIAFLTNYRPPPDIAQQFSDTRIFIQSLQI